jgi:putative Mn2+ efflux pump MntP
MMTLSPASVLALGLDGFIVCVGLGTLRFGWTRRYLLATMCGITDAVAMAAGAAYGPRVSWENLIPGIVAAWLLVILLSGKRARTLAFSLSIPLAFDNLVAGASYPIRPSLTDIAVAGAVSAALAFAGLCLGAWLAPMIAVVARRMLSAWHHVVHAALTSRFGRG